MKALVTAEFPETALGELRDLGYQPSRAGWGVTRRELPRDELIQELDDAELLICELERVDGEVLDRAGALRLVASCRGEPTNVDLEEATRHGIPVLHTPGRNAASVADFVIGIMVVEARSIARSQEHLRRNGWNVSGDLPYFHFRGPELGGKTLGIVGFGAIGAEVARRAVEGFGMRAIVYDPYVEAPPPPYRAVTLSELLEQSDVVSLHCPPTQETIGMIGSRELERMKPSAYLINTARAQIVDEQSLVDALGRRVIAGAALDVFWEEPLPRDHPLLDLDNVTITPHIAGAADDVRVHQAAMVLEDIARWHAGERPLRLANPAVWESSEVTLP